MNGLLERNGTLHHVYHHHLFPSLIISSLSALLISIQLQCPRISRKPSTLNHREMSPVNRTKQRYKAQRTTQHPKIQNTEIAAAHKLDRI